MFKCTEIECIHDREGRCEVGRREYPDVGRSCSSYYTHKNISQRPNLLDLVSRLSPRPQMLTWLLVALTLVGVQGCTGTIERAASHAQDYRDQVVELGATLNDDALNSAEFVICYGASIGSIRRKFGTHQRAVVWQNLCNGGLEFVPLTAPMTKAYSTGGTEVFLNERMSR